MANSTKSTETGAEDLQAQIAALRDELGALTAAMAEYGRAHREELRVRATDTARHLREEGEAQLARAGDQAREAYHQTEDYITRQPMTAVAIAAGAGFVLGLLSAARR